MLLGDCLHWHTVRIADIDDGARQNGSAGYEFKAHRYFSEQAAKGYPAPQPRAEHARLHIRK